MLDSESSLKGLNISLSVEDSSKLYVCTLNNEGIKLYGNPEWVE